MLRPNPIFIMSLMGSIAFLLYKLSLLFAARFFSPQWRRYMLMICMAFYLLPFWCLKYWFLKLWQQIFPTSYDRFYPITNVLRADEVILVSSAETQVPLYILVMYVMVAISVVISIAITAIQFYGYRNSKVLLLDVSEKVDLHLPATSYLTNREKTIPVYSCSSTIAPTPMTIGVFRPRIFIPAEMVEQIRAGQDTHLYFHELTHIRHRDSLLKIFSVLMFCIHWFNPFCYLLIKELNAVCEIYCDAEVTRNYSEYQKDQYCESLLKLSQQKYQRLLRQYITDFSNTNQKVVQRRLYEMTGKHFYKRGLAFLSSCAICVCTLPVAFAYTNPAIEETPAAFSEDPDVTVAEFSAEEDLSSLDTPSLQLPYDLYFISDEGEISEITAPDPERILCPHTYVNGTIKRHTLDGNGGCTLYVYDGQKCSLCGKVIYGDLQSKTYYPVCPH